MSQEFRARLDKEKAIREKQRVYVILFLVIIQLINMAAAIIGGSFFYYNLCGTNAGLLTLPVWLLTCGLVNAFCDVAFALLVYFYYHDPCKSKNAAGTVPVGAMIYTLCVGLPVGIVLLCGLAFQIAWFVIGAIALSSVSDKCIHDALPVYVFSIVEMITTPLAAGCLKFAIWKTFE